MKLKLFGVPAGNYVAEFVSCEPRAATGEFGPALIWTFDIVGGQYDGQSVSRFTGASPTAKNACGKFCRSLTGAALNPGEEIDLDAYRRRRYHVLVADSPNGGGTRVESLVPVTQEGAA